MAGVNDLPVEVLGYIFDLTIERVYRSKFCHGKYIRIQSGEYHRTRAPFVFLQVCGHWRAVAEATSHLWTSLDASMPMLITRTLKATVSLEHWLSLSHGALLDLFLETTNRTDDTLKDVSSTHAVAMLHVLAKEAYRWHSIALDMDPHLAGVFVDTMLNQFTPGSLSNLKRLEVVALRDHETPAPVQDLVRAIASISSLRELHLVLNTEDNIPLLLGGIPWGQLTTVSLGMALPTVDQAVFFLSHLTNAVTVSFGCVFGIPTSTSGSQRSKLPKLKNLSLNGTESLLTIFGRFDFPCLEQLTITSHSLTAYSPLERLLEQPNVPIRRFSLHVITRLSESDLARYLRLQKLRQVSHVEFRNTDILAIAAKAIAQVKEDIPILWSWESYKGRPLVGWKPQFDHNDGQVAHITPASTTALA